MMPSTTEPQVHGGHNEEIGRGALCALGQPQCRDPHTTEPQVHEGHQEDIRRSDLSVLGQPLCRDYKAQLTRSMKYLASDPLVRFIGYGVKIGGRAMGTLQTVDNSQLIEMPVAENLMVGFAIGLALKGLKPVVFIERFDFILNALDAIVNHLDKIHTISRGEFQPTMILRVVVGNRDKPLFTGETHTQDFSLAMEQLVSFPVVQLRHPETIFAQYKAAHAYLGKRSTMLVEYKDLM